MTTDTLTAEQIQARLDEIERESGGSGEFKDIPRGQYLIEFTSAKDFKRDRNGILRAQLEFTITGWAADAGEKFEGRKLWENSALEGEQFNYLAAGMIGAFAKRNPDKRNGLAAIPFYKEAVPEGEEQQWVFYLEACEGLDFIANVRPYKETYQGKERTK